MQRQHKKIIVISNLDGYKQIFYLKYRLEPKLEKKEKVKKL